MMNTISFESLPQQVATLTVEVMELKTLLKQLYSMPEDQAEVIGLSAVARITGYSEGTIYQYVHNGKIPYHKPEHGGRKLIFIRSEIEAWLKGTKKETSEEFVTRKERELIENYNVGVN